MPSRRQPTFPVGLSGGARSARSAAEDEHRLDHGPGLGVRERGVGDRWTALIVGALEDGPPRFNEIRDATAIRPKC
jgi:hypothetical protein